MDERRFDLWTRTMAGAASRRDVMRGAAAAIVATFVRRAADVEAAATTTCVANGEPCDPANPRGCCSGACGKTGGRHRCKPARGASGCTVLQNGCIEGMGGSCPGNRKGGCISRDNGKPYCALSASCFPCAVDADCDRAFKTTGGVCVTDCPICQAEHLTSACMFPKPIPMAASAWSPLRHD